MGTGQAKGKCYNDKLFIDVTEVRVSGWGGGGGLSGPAFCHLNSYVYTDISIVWWIINLKLHVAANTLWFVILKEVLTKV